MKKSLLALAALTAFAGAASAQSSVTLFGIVDAAYAHVSAGGKSATGMTNSALNSSRLGFRGTEDMGGGLLASFWLEMGLGNDNGTAGGGNSVTGNAAATGLGAAGGALFNRKSTVSLSGAFGEVRLGRDYTPHFYNGTQYDPFGTNGIGQALSLGLLANAGLAPGTLVAGTLLPNDNAAVRINNSVSYFLPGNLGGLSAQVMYAFGEQLSNAANKGLNDYFGFRVGYGAGPLSVQYGYGNTKGNTGAGNVKANNIGVAFDLGVVRPMALWSTEKAGSGAKVTLVNVGVTAPMGQSELRASYGRYDVSGVSATVNKNDWNKMSFGYGYNLSKRTQVFGTYARVSNKGAATVAVSNNGLSAGAASPGGNATGYEFGVRHSF